LDVKENPRLVARDTRDIFAHGGDWKHLLRSSDGSYTSTSAGLQRWQDCFQLRDLKIVLAMEDERCFMRYPGRWAGYTLEKCQHEVRFAGTYIDVNAEQLENEVQGLECSSSLHGVNCDGACARVIKQAVDKLHRQTVA
jgi:hypothetical protein